MKKLTDPEIERYRMEMTPEMLRVMKCQEDYDRQHNGSFLIDHNGVVLVVIAASGGGWDHLSISTKNRCPTWEEMELVARLFFREDEVAMQLHVPFRDHINNFPFCLHWWRPWSSLRKIPLPPRSFV